MEIVLIGSGNVATQITLAFNDANIKICQIYSRSFENAKILADKAASLPINNLASINNKADLYIFAVTDDVLPFILEQLHFKLKFAVHTSGSLPMSVFDNFAIRKGVFYPFQSLKKNQKTVMRDVPICIESDSEDNLNKLELLGKKISNTVLKINSEQRKYMHLSAVFANNFVNHLYVISQDILQKHNLPFSVLHHLIKETTNKAITGNPTDNQTGPAIRRDFRILNLHYKLLDYAPDFKKIYSFVSESIQNINLEKKMNFKERLTKVKAFVFDVDGVLSGNVLLRADGELLRTVNTKDGFAIKFAINRGYPVAVISGGKSRGIKLRFQALGVTDVYLASTNKIEDFEDFYYKYSLNPEDILYMGDDLPDYHVMKLVGVPTCPSDACEEIKACSVYISDKKGGEGCVRDVIEQVLRAQEKWINLNEKFDPKN